MSYYFELFGSALSSRELLEMLPGQVECDAMTDAPLGPEVTAFFRPGMSTRGVQVGWSESTYRIGVMTLASREDYALAVEIAAALGEYLLTEIDAENFDEHLTPDRLRTLCDQAWLDHMQYTGVDIVHRLLQEDKQVILYGYRAPVILDQSWLLRHSLNQVSTPDFYSACTRVMRRIQSLPDNGVRIPSLLEVREKDADKSYTLILWIPTQAAFLRHADRIALDGDTQLIFPAAGLAALAESLGGELLDASQYLVPALSENQIHHLREQLQNQSGPKAARAWWKFWQK